MMLNKETTMPTAVQRLNEAAKDWFMKPQCYRGADIQSEIMEAGLDLEDDKVYARLSASGYLDCTDWSGPYADTEEAAKDLLRRYGDEG
jgi:hypothetical protein